MVKDIARQYPRRVALIVVAASALGFAISPATVLAQKYLLTNWLVIEKMARDALAMGIPEDGEIRLVMV
jgi:hypothetical protein